jgi:hypothetical protein
MTKITNELCVRKARLTASWAISSRHQVLRRIIRLQGKEMMSVQDQIQRIIQN